MVMLSELLRFRLVTAEGDTLNLIDLTIDQLDTDYPPVAHLVFRLPNQREEQVLPWKSVKGIDPEARQINVENHKQANEVDTLGQEVRLGHDVLDALILDLQHRRTTRANDLWLEEKGGT